MKLVLIGLTAATIAFASIFYILSLANMQTVITEVSSLAEARLLIEECKGVHKVTRINNILIVKCRG